MGLHGGRACFPVADAQGVVIGRHVFQWPEQGGVKAWYAPGKNTPLVIGALSLAGVRVCHVIESQWDALALLHARGWTGKTMDKPFVVTRGTSVSPALKAVLAGVEDVTFWMQCDTVKVEGKPPPAEEWLVRCRALMPDTVNGMKRVNVPEGFKDWNDVLRDKGSRITNAATIQTPSKRRSVSFFVSASVSGTESRIATGEAGNGEFHRMAVCLDVNHTVLNRDLKVHSTFCQGGELLALFGGDLPHLEVVGSCYFGGGFILPCGSGGAEAVNGGSLGLAASAENALFIGLSNVDQVLYKTGEISLHKAGLICFPHVFAELQRAEIVSGWGIEHKGQQSNHHALIGFRRMARNG